MVEKAPDAAASSPTPNTPGSPFDSSFSADFGAGPLAAAPITLTQMQSYLAQAISLVNYVSVNLKNMVNQ